MNTSFVSLDALFRILRAYFVRWKNVEERLIFPVKTLLIGKTRVPFGFKKWYQKNSQKSTFNLNFRGEGIAQSKKGC